MKRICARVQHESFGSNKMATITSEDAKIVANLPKSEGRDTLLHCLKWVAFDEDKEMRKAIHLDILYDNLMYGAEKGFTWEKITCLVNFADELVHQIKVCDKITDILSFYNIKATSLSEELGDRDFKIYTSFVFSTILPQFKLYKLVFTTARQEQVPNVPLKVEPPFDSEPLKSTKPLKVWDYETKIEELERKESERANERLTDKEQKLSKLKSESDIAIQKTLQVENTLDKESVSSIIQDVMRQYTMAATESLKFDIEQLQENLEFKLEKTSLPRPQALGPPPRYSVQATLKTPSSKAPKSPKPPSRGSARSKKK